MTSPDVSVRFNTLAKTAIQRSEQGILGLIVKDSTQTEYISTISTIDDIDESKWDSDVIKYMKIAMYTLSPKKIIVFNQGIKAINEVLKEVKTKRINYLAAPQAEEEEDQNIIIWVKQVFGTTIIDKTVKYISGYADNSDHPSVIEFSNETMTSIYGTFTAQEYTAAIAGMLCGMPLNRSADNLIMADLTNVSFIEPALGKFNLYVDDDVVRVNLAINSKTSFDSTWKSDTRYIKIVEGMCMVVDDIKNTFRDYWIGKYMNDYDNKMNFCSNINKVYFKDLEPNVLSPDYDNYVEIDLEKQKQEIVLDGRHNPEEMTELEILKFPTGNNVYLKGDVMFSNTMVNLSLVITM